jgi:hypothetical protein
MARYLFNKEGVAQHERTQVGRAASNGFKEFAVALQLFLMAGREVIPESPSGFCIVSVRQPLFQSTTENPKHGIILDRQIVKRKHQLGAEAGGIIFEQQGPAVEFHDACHKAEAQAIAWFGAA